MLSIEAIKTALEKGFTGSHVQVRDMTGGNDHFEVVIRAPAFQGKSLVERHRMVYSVVWPETNGQIHALALKTLAPDEAE